MDRNSLFAVAVGLAVITGGVYYYKSNGYSFTPKSNLDSWQRDDPGWEKMKADPIEAPPSPEPPKLPDPPKIPEQPQRG